MIYASCKYKEYEEYKEKTLFIKKGFDEKSKLEQVKLNIEVSSKEEYEELGDLSSPSLGCVTCLNFTPDVLKEGVDVFCSYPAKGNVREVVDKTPKGFKLLFRIEKEYPNLKKLINFGSYSDCIRFTGGNLLAIEGLRVGRYDEKKSPLCFGIYDSFVEDTLENIKKMGIILKSKSTRAPSGSNGTSSKVGKVNRVSTALNSLFGAEDIDEEDDL